jgi:hypothetical protein
MNYKLSIAEGVISTMTGLSVAGIQKVMNLLEVEEEFFDFAEDAFLTLQGLRALKVDLDVSGWERRMTSLREEWARMAPLVAAAFGDKLHGVRMRGMRIKPPEYWWEHTLADAARG